MSIQEVAPTTVLEGIQKSTKDQKNETAFIFYRSHKDFEIFTYGAFWSEVEDFSKLLVAKDIKRNDRIALILDNGLEVCRAFLGIMSIGAIPVILPPPSVMQTKARYAETLKHIASSTEVSTIFTDSKLIKVLESIEDSELRVFSCDDTPKEITLPSEWPIKCDPNDIAFMQCSSGTTGLQKAIEIHHEQLVKHLELGVKTFDYTHRDTIISWLPLYHDMGLIATFLMPLFAGARIVQMKAMDWLRKPHILLDAITQHSGTYTFLPNFAFNHLTLKAKKREIDWDLGSLRGLFNGSEPISDRSMKDCFKRFKEYGLEWKQLCCGYGLAENVLVVSHTPIGKEPNWLSCNPKKLENGRIEEVAEGGKIIYSSGPPMNEVTVKIYDESGKEMGDKVVGEIGLQSPTQIKEYKNDPESTKMAVRDGILFTGDLGFIHEGEVYVTGRKKDLIIVGGRNIYPHDIEEAVSALANVKKGKAVAIGVFDDNLGTERILVAVETAGQLSESDSARLVDQIKEAVTEDVDVPIDEVVIVPNGSIKKTTSGKLARGKTLAEIERLKNDSVI